MGGQNGNAGDALNAPGQKRNPVGSLRSFFLHWLGSPGFHTTFFHLTVMPLHHLLSHLHHAIAHLLSLGDHLLYHRRHGFDFLIPFRCIHGSHFFLQPGIHLLHHLFVLGHPLFAIFHLLRVLPMMFMSRLHFSLGLGCRRLRLILLGKDGTGHAQGNHYHEREKSPILQGPLLLFRGLVN